MVRSGQFVLKVGLNEVWKRRVKDSSKFEPEEQQRKTKEQVGLRHINSERILGHPGGKNLQTSALQRVGFRGQDGAGPLIATSGLYFSLQALFPHQPILGFQADSTKIEFIMYAIPKKQISSPLIWHISPKRLRWEELRWCDSTAYQGWIFPLGLDKSLSLLLSRALPRCLQTFHLLCCSFFLPGMASLLPTELLQDTVYGSTLEWSPLWPGQPTWGLLWNRESWRVCFQQFWDWT